MLSKTYIPDANINRNSQTPKGDQHKSKNHSDSWNIKLFVLEYSNAPYDNTWNEETDPNKDICITVVPFINCLIHQIYDEKQKNIC